MHATPSVFWATLPRNDGADDRARTGDLVLTKDALCQLSYIGLTSCSQPLGGDTWSGRRGSNPQPTAWKAVTLPLSYSRQKSRARRLVSSNEPAPRNGAGGGTRTPDPLITNQMLYQTELRQPRSCPYSIAEQRSPAERIQIRRWGSRKACNPGRKRSSPQYRRIARPASKPSPAGPDPGPFAADRFDDFPFGLLVEVSAGERNQPSAGMPGRGSRAFIPDQAGSGTLQGARYFLVSSALASGSFLTFSVSGSKCSTRPTR